MKKLLLFLCGVFAMFSLNAQFTDDFEAYNVGDKLAEAAQAAGNDFWTTWSSAPGGAEDAVIADFDGSKVAYFTYGNDQVVLLGDKTTGQWRVTFDIYVDEGNNGYFNMLHKFAGQGSEWGFECYLNDPSNGSVLKAAGTSNSFTFPLAQWVPVKIDYDLDADQMTLNINEVEVYTGQFSAQSSGGAGTRQLAAMDFFPPANAATSMFYVDNVVYENTGGEAEVDLNFPTSPIEVTLEEGETDTETLTIENVGTPIGDYNAWLTYDTDVDGDYMEGSLKYCAVDMEQFGMIGFSNVPEPLLIEIANKYPAEFYKDKIGTYLTTISFIPAGVPAENVYKFRVYGHGKDNEPGEVLAEAELAVYTPQAWNVVELSEPVLLEGGDIWVSVEFSQPDGDTYLMTYEDSTPHDIYDGSWNRTKGGSWQRLTETQPADFPIVNWLLYADFAGTAINANWLSLEGDLAGSLFAGESADVNINFNSTGLDDAEYNATLNVKTNDPDLELVEIPVKLTVGGDGIEVINRGLEIYPNPAANFVNVKADSDIANLSIYNAIGQLIYSAENLSNNVNVNVSSFNSGIYFIVINAGGTSKTTKLVVE